MYTAGHSLRAKVRRQLHNWWSAGASLEVLRWIREGVRMDWAAEPPANFHQGRSFANCSPAERKFVQEEVQRLLESGAIREAQPCWRSFVSCITPWQSSWDMTVPPTNVRAACARRARS